MAKKDQFLTTAEFASRAGVPTSSITNLIRKGKIKAEKKSGKWMIAPDQLGAKAVKELSVTNKTAASKKEKPVSNQTAAGKTYSIPEFAAMTYLTEKGIKDWLKQGRLTGRQDKRGNWLVDAANLETPDVKRLLR